MHAMLHAVSSRSGDPLAGADLASEGDLTSSRALIKLQLDEILRA